MRSDRPSLRRQNFAIKALVETGQGGDLNQNHKYEHFWLFERYKSKEITDLVMLGAEDIDTPRLHKNTYYQKFMLDKIEEIINHQGYMEDDEGTPQSSKTKKNGFRSSFSLAKSKSLVKNREEIGTVPISSNLEVIPHANELTTNKSYLRTPTGITVTDYKKEDGEILKIITRNTTQNLMFLHNEMGPYEDDINFDQDFILCTVYGYKNVIFLFFGSLQK